jgi:monofunctional chorismate mutase
MDELKKARKEINAIDDKLLLLLSHRMKVVKKVGEYKIKNNIPIVDKKREKEVVEVLKGRAEELDLIPDQIAKIWKEIFKLAYEYEK